MNIIGFLPGSIQLPIEWIVNLILIAKHYSIKNPVMMYRGAAFYDFPEVVHWLMATTVPPPGGEEQCVSLNIAII